MRSQRICFFMNLGPVKKFLAGQLIFCIVLTLFFLLFFGRREGVSAFLGGLGVIIPSLLFARRLFRHKGAKAYKEILSSFYSAEGLKLLTTALFFILVFTLYQAAFFVFFLSYGLLLMTHWFSPWLVDNKYK